MAHEITTEDVRTQLMDLADSLGIDDDEAGEPDWESYLSDVELAEVIIRLRPDAREQVTTIVNV